MKKIIRAIWFYPMLLTICLLIEMIYGTMILVYCVITLGKNVPKEIADDFKFYPKLFHKKHYFAYIKNGIDWDYIIGNKTINEGA